MGKELNTYMVCGTRIWYMLSLIYSIFWYITCYSILNYRMHIFFIPISLREQIEVTIEIMSVYVYMCTVYVYTYIYYAGMYIAVMADFHTFVVQRYDTHLPLNLSET